MARNRVHGGDRIKVIASSDHSAGDLVYEKGFYGIAQDDVTSGDLFTVILEGVWRLAYVPSTLAMGTVVTALATAQATASLQLLPWAAHASQFAASATASWNRVGRVIETGTATTAKIQLQPQNVLNY